MRFERVPLAEALGAIAGHSVGHGQGAVKKGALLDEAAIAALEQAGVSHVYAVRLEEGDVPENEAARAFAEAWSGPGTQVQALATGRANLKASDDGLVLVDTAAVNAFNGVDEGVTFATLAAYARVKTGQRVATAKIIPFAVPAGAMRHALAICEASRRIAVAPFRPHRIALILTRVPDTKPSLLTKSEQVMGERITALGSSIAGATTVGHETEAIAEGIAKMAGGCDMVIVLGAAAIADRNDVVPAGLVRAGGAVTHLGMPVEPGNLLMLGELGGMPVIGAPSCARSPKENGFDWVLQRLLAGLEVGPGDIMGMGVGGLLL